MFSKSLLGGTMSSKSPLGGIIDALDVCNPNSRYGYCDPVRPEMSQVSFLVAAIWVSGVALNETAVHCLQGIFKANYQGPADCRNVSRQRENSLCRRPWKTSREEGEHGKDCQGPPGGNRASQEHAAARVLNSSFDGPAHESHRQPCLRRFSCE